MAVVTRFVVVLCTTSRLWESTSDWWIWHRKGPLARYVKLLVAHAPGMPGTFSPPPRVSDPDMHHGTCVTHVPWCMPGLLTSGFFWSRWRGKRSRHSRRMRNPQFYVSGKRSMGQYYGKLLHVMTSTWNPQLYAPSYFTAIIVWYRSLHPSVCWSRTTEPSCYCRTHSVSRPD